MMYVPHFVYPCISGFLGCFYLLTILNDTAMNIVMQIYFRYLPRSGITGSYGYSILNFLRDCHTIFHGSCPIPTNSAQEFQFLHILANTCYFLPSFTVVHENSGIYRSKYFLRNPRLPFPPFLAVLFSSVKIQTQAQNF